MAPNESLPDVLRFAYWSDGIIRITTSGKAGLHCHRAEQDFCQATCWMVDNLEKLGLDHGFLEDKFGQLWEACPPFVDGYLTAWKLISPPNPGTIKKFNESLLPKITDVDFLMWIYERLEHIHGEDPNADFMHKLRSIIAVMTTVNHFQSHD